MQIYYNQLDEQLDQKLKPIYIIAGDEVYQEDRCVDKIIKKSNQNSFIEHEIMYVEKTFDWSNFEFQNTNLSLFGDKKIIEVRFLTKTVGFLLKKKFTNI